LREYLRVWRSEVAKKQGMPAFTVLHDTSLDDLCRVMPESTAALRGVYGFGERKTEKYGREILAAISRFRQGARAPATATSSKKQPPREQTVKLVAEGKTFEEIARIRGCQVGSVVALVASMVEGGELVFREGWVEAEKRARIEKACTEHGTERLKPIKDALPAEITFDEIRLVVARLRHEQAKPQDAGAPSSL
jgi:ATP-dependent DNA helicase RecQ